MEKISKAVSYIYHPLIIPTLGMLVLFNSGSYLSYLPMDMKKGMLLIVFLCTYVIPLFFIPYFLFQSFLNHLKRSLTNVQMETRRERNIPIAISFILNVVCYLLIRKITVPHMYHAFIISSILAVLATLIINLKYKISIHMVGAGGLVALIGFLAFYLRVNLQFYLILSLLLAGITGTSRLFLKAHSPDQIYVGFLTGFTIVLLTLALSQ